MRTTRSALIHGRLCLILAEELAPYELPQAVAMHGFTEDGILDDAIVEAISETILAAVRAHPFAEETERFLARWMA